MEHFLCHPIYDHYYNFSREASLQRNLPLIFHCTNPQHGGWNFRWGSGSSPHGNWDYRWGLGSGPGGRTWGFGSGNGQSGGGSGFGFGWGGSSSNSSGGHGFYYGGGSGDFGFGYGGGGGGLNFNGRFGFDCGPNPPSQPRSNGQLEQRVNEVGEFYLTTSKKQPNTSKGSSIMKDKGNHQFFAGVLCLLLIELGQITQHKWAWPFMHPVDVEGLGFHDYYEEKRREEEEAEAQLNLQLAQEAAHSKVARDLSNELYELNMHLEELREMLVQKCSSVLLDQSIMGLALVDIKDSVME
ncbi:hypothetical protein F0562_026036 [Nyssa sinensis]|uniref:Uncharacterized protein n=1 Tax=Nyssa sinensis TaxID=561372 RepID=A0A5J5B9M8_9ASTE|nr:hypothetical protein F0562_026036 [Nyssa sinensis]